MADAVSFRVYMDPTTTQSYDPVLCPATTAWTLDASPLACAPSCVSGNVVSGVLSTLSTLTPGTTHQLTVNVSTSSTDPCGAISATATLPIRANGLPTPGDLSIVQEALTKSITIQTSNWAGVPNADLLECRALYFRQTPTGDVTLNTITTQATMIELLSHNVVTTIGRYDVATGTVGFQDVTFTVVCKDPATGLEGHVSKVQNVYLEYPTETELFDIIVQGYPEGTSFGQVARHHQAASGRASKFAPLATSTATIAELNQQLVDASTWCAQMDKLFNGVTTSVGATAEAMARIAKLRYIKSLVASRIYSITTQLPRMADYMPLATTVNTFSVLSVAMNEVLSVLLFHSFQPGRRWGTTCPAHTRAPKGRKPPPRRKTDTPSNISGLL